MSELWETEMEQEPDIQKPDTQEPEIQEPEPQESTTAPGALTVSANDFAALEERVLRTVAILKQERQARVAAETRVAEAEKRVREQAAAIDELNPELTALRAERDQVRQRVERLLTQLDTLEL